MHTFFHALEAVVVHAMSNVGVVKCLLNGHLKGLSAPLATRAEVVRTESTIGEEVEISAQDSTP